jgi:hypothetical protein
LFIFVKPFAQVKLKGTIDAKGASVENIHISNLSNEKSTISKADGTFEIEAEEGDLLTFHAIHLEFWRQSVKPKDIACSCIAISLLPKTMELEGVEVTEYTKINAVSLGIVSPNIVRRTQAERRLYTATSGGGLIALDPIINAITGRTKMLKEELVIERLERLEKQVFDLIDKEYFTEVLNIHPDYHRGFVRISIHDILIEQAVEKRNEDRLQFLLKEKAVNFLQIRPEANLNY